MVVMYDGVMSSVLACGPYFTPDMVLASLAVLSVGKLPIYLFFLLAFRYRVSTAAPLSAARIFGLAALRTLLGLLVFSTAWLLLPNSFERSDIALRWIVLLAERSLIWAFVGWFAMLRGRRLLGFIVSGTGIDLAYDLVIPAMFLASPATGLSAGSVLGFFGFAFVGFLLPLHVIGRRPSLRSRFLAANMCCTCGYDLVGLAAPVCPECGTPAADVSGA